MFLSGDQFKAGKQLKKIRTLFGHAGRIREIQIEQLLIESMETELGIAFPEYLEYLQQREHREIARFLKHLPAYGKRTEILNDRKVNKAIGSLDPEKLEALASDFMRIKGNRIAGNISKPTSNKRIHSNRTHLKQLYYLFDILTALTGKELLLGLTHEQIRDIEQYLGEWHDLVNSPVYMRAFFKVRNYRGDKRYMALNKRIAARRKRMRQEIITTLFPLIKT
jgi:CHAD domain-containing protein